MSFYTDVIAKDPRYRSLSAVTSTSLLFQPFLVAVMNILQGATTPDHTFHIGETYRSRERQRYLFDKSLTRLRNVGVHHYGLACDIIMFVDGKYETRGDRYSILQPLCKRFGVIWGGDWGDPPPSKHSFNDWDHLQFIKVSDQDRLFSSQWYPPRDYLAQGA